MNILVEQLPDAIEIDEHEYTINTDFRVCLRSILAFEDDELTPVEKNLVLLNNLYTERPSNAKAAIEQGIKFLNGGKLDDDDEESSGNSVRVYSFSKDSDFIFAAFKQTHGIDLAEIEYLHWWKFLALFMDLGSETTFTHLIGLRKRLKDGTASKEERKAASKMRRLVDLPERDTRTASEKEIEADFLRLVAEGKKHASQS